MFIIISGNPVDGFAFTGPFPTHEDATEWAELISWEFSWWIAPIAEST